MNSDTRHDSHAPVSAPVRDNVTVHDLLADWPMKGFFCKLPRRLSGAATVLTISLVLLCVLIPVLLIGGRKTYFNFPAKPTVNESGGGVASEKGDRPYADGVSGNVLLPWADNVQIIPANSINAAHAALADLKSGEIIASRKADEIIYPASMTKVMTLIVVAENLPSEDCLTDVITISQDIYDEMKRQGSSGIGLEPGEKLTVEALLYALMLRSDGIAACELARYVTGNVEDFVELMNQKAEKMGLTNTHFENPTGLFHASHTSTCREIASIMTYAMNMSLCRKILLTQHYNAPCVGADGKTFHYTLLHNLMITHFESITPNQPTTVKIAAGKTGFTDESLYCLVTYAESTDGHGYVCVTAKGESYRACVQDYRTIYDTYVTP